MTTTLQGKEDGAVQENDRWKQAFTLHNKKKKKKSLLKENRLQFIKLVILDWSLFWVFSNFYADRG